MTNKIEGVNTQARQKSRTTRNKKQRYSKEVYGARVPHEDARVLDDYGRANKLERSDVIRYALHQFALRQQMLCGKKDPLRETVEGVVAEQIAPVYNRVEETAAMLHQLAGFLIGMKQSPTVPASAGVFDGASAPLEGVDATCPPTQVLKEHKRLLEKTLMAAMLVLRLHVNYVVEPVLRDVDARAGSKAETYLRAAIQGRDMWSETTRDVITRTGNRILFELNLITKEDWEKLLQTYEGRTS